MREETQAGAAEAAELRRGQLGGDANIWLCGRVANIPVAKDLGLEHRWLMTNFAEAGMGACGGGVPGNQADSPYVTETCVNDHTGEHASNAATCVPVGNIDRGCVDRVLKSHRELGAWTLTN